MSSREEKPLGLNIGSASIIMVFTVLCLTVFSVLAFVSAASEYKTAQRFAESTRSYYEADANAMQIRNSIAGELTDSAAPTDVSYCVQISDDRRISVELAYDGSVWHTVKWQEENVSDWKPDAEMEITDPDTVK